MWAFCYNKYNPLVNALLLVLLICICYPHAILTNAALTCQGGSYISAINSCPDQGAQLMSAGGNVTIRVIRAKNLPNKDNSATVAGYSDPYVKFTVGNIVKMTNSRRNDLNPVWNEDVNLGFLGSATLISVEIWDQDAGLEYGDDLLVRSSIRVPFCSTFHANESTHSCGTPFNCKVDDSLWQMPKRKFCNETESISFNGHSCLSNKGICLFIEVHIVPFQMSVELTYPNAVHRTPVLSVAGPVTRASWTSTYGFPFLSSSTFLDSSADSARFLKGALMLRMLNTEKSYGAANAIKFYAATNFPAVIYVCRYLADNTAGIPTWLKEFDGTFVNSRRLLIRGTTERFGCFFKNYTGTPKNRWGGVMGGAIPFKTNTLAGRDSNSIADQTFYRYNYVVLAIPRTVAEREDVVRVYYDADTFVGFLGSYGLICMWFIYLIFRFLSKIDYRVDRISNFVATRVLTGKDRSLVATLLLINGQSPCNIEYRSHIFYARNIISFFIVLPFLLLISWGMSVAIVVRPPMLGAAITFMGASMLFFWYGYRLWERSQWRLSLLAITSFSIAVFWFIVFLIISLFLDLGVLHFGHSLDIVALSLIFGTINCIPCLFLIFKHDRSHRVYMELVVGKIAEAVALLKQQTTNTRAEAPQDKSLLINRILHALLGETYSVNPKIPALKYSVVMNEIKSTVHNVATAMEQDGVDANSIEKLKKALTEERRLYGSSLFILFVYLMFAAGGTDSGSLAFLNVCALLLLDFIHASIAKGECNWSPGFKILLLVMGRILICSSPKSIWIINYSACFILYALTLIYEMIDTFLPKLTLRKAGEIVFGGSEYQQSIRDSLKTSDISGSALFCLGFLLVSFVAVLIIAAYLPNDSEGKEQLLVPTLDVLGMHSWPAYVFGLIAFLVAGVAGVAMATKRVFDLDAHGLLRGWAEEVYLFRTDMKLPRVLALSTEISILLSGLLIYAITNAAAVLVGAIFIPVIILCFGYSWKVWIKNDFELVVWPRKAEIPTATASLVADAKAAHENGQNDLDIAFNMIENMFGNNHDDMTISNVEDDKPESDENFIENQTALINRKQTLKGAFELPPLRPTGNKLESKEIKMPPLPLKSVLRRKRQNMGVKTQAAAVKDLHGREIGKESDQFGNKKDDVIDINDPWAQFEKNEEEEALLTTKKKKVIGVAAQGTNPYESVFRPSTTTKVKQKIYSYVEFVKSVKRFMRTNKYMKKLTGYFKSTTDFIKRKTKVYPSIYQPNLTGNDDDLDNVESAKKKVGNGDDDELEELVVADESSDVSKLPFWEAFWAGYLNHSEYMAIWSWFGGLFAIMLFGIVLSATVSPKYLGYCIWMATWLFLFFYIPIYKYFQVYYFDDTAKSMFRWGFLIHFLFCVSFFGSYLHGDASLASSLWVLDFFFYYPIITYMIFWVCKWTDSNFKLPIFDKNNDGQVSLKEVLMFLKTFPAMLVSVILLNWQFYVWINYTVGIVVSLILIMVAFGYIYINDWASNDYFLSPELVMFGKFVINFSMFISGCVAIFRPGYQTIFPVSVFFFIWAFSCGLNAIGRYMLLDKGSIFFFAPNLFPVYSYNTTTQDLVDESEFVMDFVKIFMLGTVWGLCMTIFYYPIHIGMSIACGFLMVAAAAASLCISSIPRQLAKCNAMLTPESVLEAANFAKEKFLDRRVPMSLEISNFDPEHNEYNIPVALSEAIAPTQHKSMLDKLKEKTCLENSLAVMADIRALKYIKNDSLLLDDDNAGDSFGGDYRPSDTLGASQIVITDKKIKKKPAPGGKKGSSWFMSKFGGSKKPKDGDEAKDGEDGEDGEEGGNNDDAEKAIEDKAPEAVEEEEQDEYEEPWYKKKWQQFKDYARKMYELLPVNKKDKIYVRHQHAPFGFTNAAIEIFFTGRGPFGLFGIEGYWLNLLVKFKESKHFHFLYPEWTEYYDLVGNDLREKELAEAVDYSLVLSRINECDKAIDYTCKEEVRCAVHFLLMLIVSADAKLEREKVLFQKFLRENRFRLASNGITPPKDIFSSVSYASINIPLVAIWLSKLSTDEQERFYMLKQTFNADQKERDELIDQSDYEASVAAHDLEKARKLRDVEYMTMMQFEITKRKEQRIQAFYDTLDTEFERQKFMQRRDLWTRDPECFVDLKEKELYDKFRNKCKVFEAHSFEFNDYAVNYLMDCETAQKDIRLGEYGRQYQFVDSMFPPSEISLGDGDASHQVLGWRCSPGIVENMQLFENGTHPDDVSEGVFRDQWLLSAMSMLVATTTMEGGGTVYAKGFINDRIRALFIPHPTAAADPNNLDPTLDYTLDTEVGSYGLQIYRNNEWVPIIIDDLLPMRKKEDWTNENRGVAGAHCKEGRGLWVALIEKAYAKYYGSFSALEEGFVHQALKDLTGCDAECIYLNNYSRGYSKFALWDNLQQYKKNGYILGAGTGSAELVDKELQEMGICFNAAYTIYDVIQVDNVRLLRLRNPPGDHSEWKGDWSDHSNLWNRRYKHKVEYSDDEFDNTFYISLDDFLNVFRYLYVCRYYNPKKWSESKHNGFWKKANEAEIEQMEMMNQFFQEQGDNYKQSDDDVEKINRKKAKARLDSAGGLPSKHNPGCVLENNPHYSLRIYRPSDIRITVTQVPNNPKLTNKPNHTHTQLLLTPIPFTIMVVRNRHHNVPQRLEELKKEDVLYSTGEPSAEKSLSLYINGIKPGLYMVLVGAYLAGMEGCFSITALTNYRCEFTPVWPPVWMLKDDSKKDALTAQEQFEQKLSKGGLRAKKGIQQMGEVFGKGFKSLLGGDEFGDDENEEEDTATASKAGGGDKMDSMDKYL